MEVEIGDLKSTVRVGEGDARAMDKMKQFVTQLVEEREAHQKRVHAEQRISGGVSQELEEVA